MEHVRTQDLSSDLGFSALPVADTAAPILTMRMGRAANSCFVFTQSQEVSSGWCIQHPRTTIEWVRTGLWPPPNPLEGTRFGSDATRIKISPFVVHKRSHLLFNGKTLCWCSACFPLSLPSQSPLFPVSSVRIATDFMYQIKTTHFSSWKCIPV